MSKALSLDLRVRVLEAVGRGHEPPRRCGALWRQCGECQPLAQAGHVLRASLARERWAETVAPLASKRIAR